MIPLCLAIGYSSYGCVQLTVFRIRISRIIVKFLFLSNLERFLRKHSLTHDNSRASYEGFQVSSSHVFLFRNKVNQTHPKF